MRPLLETEPGIPTALRQSRVWALRDVNSLSESWRGASVLPSHVSFAMSAAAEGSQQELRLAYTAAMGRPQDCMGVGASAQAAPVRRSSAAVADTVTADTAFHTPEGLPQWGGALPRNPRNVDTRAERAARLRRGPSRWRWDPKHRRRVPRMGRVGSRFIGSGLSLRDAAPQNNRDHL